MSYENTTFLSANGKGVVFFVSKTLFRRVQIGLSVSVADRANRQGGYCNITKSQKTFAPSAARCAFRIHLYNSIYFFNKPCYHKYKPLTLSDIAA